MNKRIPSEVIILAEDERHQSFVQSYLKGRGFGRYALRSEPLSVGRGCGEQWVRKQYATAVKSYRQRATRASSALVVVIDADSVTIEKRSEQLGRELKEAGLNPRTPNEQIIHLIPRRNIETWVLYLTGRQVDEETDYKPESEIGSKLRDAAATLFDFVRSHAIPPSPCPPSLLQAIAELKRLQ